MLADPAPGDDGNDDHGVPSDDSAGRLRRRRIGERDRGDAGARRQTSSGYRGTASDPWKDLAGDFQLATTTRRRPGNVVQGARTALNGRGSQTMTLAIGFGADARRRERRGGASLARGLHARAQAAFDGGLERTTCAALEGAAGERRGHRSSSRLYEQSLIVLAASEDKLNRGASIAAPNMPWVWGTLTLERSPLSGPYHLVWPRDFYHVATAQKMAGDDAAADRLLDYLWDVQKPDGSFWQNTCVDGTPNWTTQQMDETSLPIVLAWWLGRRGAGDWEHIRAAADYIVAEGPDTGQERWENQSGWSPNTIATEIAGLICAADVAQANGDDERAAAYHALADSWQQQVESWTATTNGPVQRRPVLPAHHEGREPERRLAPTSSGTTSRGRSTSARSSTTRSSGSCCSASRSGTTR